MSKWKCEIEKVSNGYILKHKNDDNLSISTIFEENNEECGDLNAMFELLYAVKEFFGVHHSKHNKKNLILEVK